MKKEGGQRELALCLLKNKRIIAKFTYLPIIYIGKRAQNE
jgi:hypothetical protein